MMKFFRKYNKHLLAVFMALLLIVWLGEQAFREYVGGRSSDRLMGTAQSGDITEIDAALAERETQLLRAMRLTWEQWQDGLAQTPPKSDERLGLIEWVLLKREAERFGVTVTPDQAKSLLIAAGTDEADMRLLANRKDVDVQPERLYEAAASYFSVKNMLDMYASVSRPPESELRRLARDMSENATVEAVIFPAASFADPEQTFSEEELQRQFDSYRSAREDGGLNFGYYLEPRVRVQYVRIDPQQIKEHLRGSDQTYEREAYEYWQANRDKSNDFRWSIVEVAELKREADSNGLNIIDADTNGVDSANADSNGVSSNGVVIPKAGDFYTEFRQARTKALAAVRLQSAQAEAERLITRLTQVFRDPWFAVAHDAKSGIKPAPEAVKSLDYYTAAVAALPANLQYPNGVEVSTLGWMTAYEMALAGGFGAGGIYTEEGDALRAAQLAFNVEGLADAPEEVHRESSMFLSQWETFPKPLMGSDGAAYLFRVIAVKPGKTPEKLEEVVDQVTEDLRLMAGMRKVRQGAESFVAAVGTDGLRAAWNADTELQAKVTPDRGGYVEPPPFPRDATPFGGESKLVQPFGVVTDEFMDAAFALASQGEASEVRVIDLPDEARVIAMRGLKLKPLYREDFQSRREFLAQNIARQQQSVLLSQWLNAKNVRERNQFEYARGS